MFTDGRTTDANSSPDFLTKLGTYLDLKRIWNPIDFQGQRSRSQGLIFRQGDTPRFALPLFLVVFPFSMRQRKEQGQILLWVFSVTDTKYATKSI
jgi:hypothetical protein